MKPTSIKIAGGLITTATFIGFISGIANTDFMLMQVVLILCMILWQIPESKD
jgi:hypothetical protein